MRPRDAKTETDICRLRSDHTDTETHWLMVNGGHVTLTAQRVGEKPTESMEIPRRTFCAMVDWYMREQKPRAKP